MSLALVDQVLKGRAHTRVTQSLARAFHVAAQARSFARLQKDKCPEAVFVAALLYHIGELAFWSADGHESDEIEQLVRTGMDELPTLPLVIQSHRPLRYTVLSRRHRKHCSSACVHISINPWMLLKSWSAAICRMLFVWRAATVWKHLKVSCLP